MKYIIASDIHGSYYYASKLIEAFNKEEADKLILLGDILYHGPRNDLPKEYNPKLVIPLLNNYKDKIIAVRGNCDAEVDQMVLEFPIMDDYKIIKINNKTFFLTHGHIYNKDKMPNENIDVFVNGHTHVPVCENANDVLFLNPGSVSIPKNDSHHGYIVIEKDNIIFKDFEGHIIKTYSL